jgi:CMP-N-acetylneuraminic acid synthetase
LKILVTICARGGSKGIPGKNIKLLNGLPLICYSIRVAKEFQEAEKHVDIELSTDSEKIMEAANKCGLSSSYRRPEFLADDTAGKIAAIKDILLWKEKKENYSYDYILDLDVTSPLRNLDDLRNAFGIIRSNDEAINLFSVSPAQRSPYFNMVEEKKNGFYAQVKQPDVILLTRQSAPRVYDMNASFYFYKRSFFDLGYTTSITDRSLIYQVPHVCFDLDHPIDFEILSFLISANKLDFKL